MDLLCDTLLVEEILLRLPPQSLVRLRAACRRVNALALTPEFDKRYWRPRAGVLVQPYGRSTADPESVPRFVTAGASSSASVPGADLAFMPGPTAREKAYLRTVGTPDAGLANVHSTDGLLLCSRGTLHPVHFYVCNPVTW
jgi:hypothetical protein